MQDDLTKRQRDANKAYGMSASNGMGDETESQVEAVFFTSHPDVRLQSSHDGNNWSDTYDPLARYQRPVLPATDPNEPPPLSPSDRVWGQGFWVGFIAFPLTASLVYGMSWWLVKGIDAGFWSWSVTGSTQYQYDTTGNKRQIQRRPAPLL